jgi:hypothetical protein
MAKAAVDRSSGFLFSELNIFIRYQNTESPKLDSGELESGF